MLKNIKNNSGFTIVELLIVIVVIAILAAISIVAYNGIQNRSKSASGQSYANSIAKKAEAYSTARSTGSGYPTHAELTAATSAVPEAQLDAPSTVVAYATTGAGLTTTVGNYNDNKTLIYRQLSAAGACIFYWDFAATTPARAVVPLGTATAASCVA